MSGCCARSRSTARRPISTPTCPSTTTSSSRGRTTCSTFPTPTWLWAGRRSRRKATRSRASTWWCACAARRAERLSLPSLRLRRPALPAVDVFELIHLIVRVDAPKLLLHHQTVDAQNVDAAPTYDVVH